MQYTKYTVHFYSGAMKACVALDFTTHFFCVEQFFQSCTKWHNAQDPEDGLLRERDLASKGQERRVWAAPFHIPSYFHCFLSLTLPCFHFFRHIALFFLRLGASFLVGFQLRYGPQLILINGRWNHRPSHHHQRHVDEPTECASIALAVPCTSMYHSAIAVWMECDVDHVTGAHHQRF